MDDIHTQHSYILGTMVGLIQFTIMRADLYCLINNAIVLKIYPKVRLSERQNMKKNIFRERERTFE